MYQPEPTSTGVSPLAAAIAEHAYNGRLTIYAGAGVSMGDPTNIPGARALARRLHDAVQHSIDFAGVDQEDLVAVADAIDSQEPGGHLLRRTLPSIADFDGAAWSYAHAVLAALICENAALVFETNYDNCIERSTHERFPVVVTDEDRAFMGMDALLKIHGCILRPPTMLVTSADLANPPAYTRNELGARLASGEVAFVGLGSPADYVEEVVKQLMSTVAFDRLTLVDPALSDWGASPWSEVAPGLAEERRRATTADEFCDDLLRAYVAIGLRRIADRAAALPPDALQRVGVPRVMQALTSKNSLDVVRWSREAHWKIRPGNRTADSAGLTSILIALGRIAASEDITFARGATGLLDTDLWFVAVAATNYEFGSSIALEAERRVTAARVDGTIPSGADVVVFVSGHHGPLPGENPLFSAGESLVDFRERLKSEQQDQNLVGDEGEDHIIDGIASGRHWIVDADRWAAA